MTASFQVQALRLPVVYSLLVRQWRGYTRLQQSCSGLHGRRCVMCRVGERLARYATAAVGFVMWPPYHMQNVKLCLVELYFPGLTHVRLGGFYKFMLRCLLWISLSFFLISYSIPVLYPLSPTRFYLVSHATKRSAQRVRLHYL